jgi:hypothetical protein
MELAGEGVVIADALGAQNDMSMDGRPSMQMSTHPLSPPSIGKENPASPAADDAYALGDHKRKLDGLLAELDVEIQARCQLIQNNTDDTAFSLRNKFKTLLFKLPKKARTMPLYEFADNYGAGVQEQIMCTIKAGMAAQGWPACNSHEQRSEPPLSFCDVLFLSPSPNGALMVL